MADVNPLAWDDEAVILIPNQDTVAFSDLTFVLRYNADATLRDETIRILCESPDGTMAESVLDVPLSRAAMRPKGFGETEIPYRYNVRLPLRGDYRFSFLPLRKGVRGIMAVGLRKERNNGSVAE